MRLTTHCIGILLATGNAESLINQFYNSPRLNRVILNRHFKLMLDLSKTYVG